MAKVTHAPDKTRELLLEAAKVLFSSKGYDATTVKELADHAGVNVSLVSYHFDGKEGLYRACIDQFGQARLDVAQRLLVRPQSAEELKVRLQMFVTELLECFVANPELTRIVQRECDADMPVVRDIFERTFMQIHITLVEFFAISQKQGFIRKGLDPMNVAGLLFGSLANSARTDHIREKFFEKTIKDPKFRKRLADDTLELCLNGLLNG